MTQTIESARAVLADLEGKLANATAREAALADQRRRLSFDAETGDLKARKALDEANRASVSISLEIENLRSAIEEAARRAISAERDAALEATRKKARRVQDIAAAAAPRGIRIAEAAATLRDEIKALNADLNEMRRLGAPVVNGRLVVLAMTRAILSLLREAGLDIDIIPPGLRHDPQQLVDGYVASATAWATKMLDGEAEPKREAA